jgi:hypothetical protein
MVSARWLRWVTHCLLPSYILSLLSLSLEHTFSGCDTYALRFLVSRLRSRRRRNLGVVPPFSPSHATMSRQPSLLMDSGSQGSETSDSDESENSTTMEQSNDRHVAPLAKRRLSEDCDVCHLPSMECRLNESAYHPWKRFSRIRSSALAGRRCCSLIVDAIETWLRHADHRAHSAVYLGYGLLFDTMEVRLRQYYSREKHKNGRYTINLLVDLHWQAGSNNDAEDSTRPVCLFIFAPHSMQKQAATHYIVLNDRE